jgi:hypothetical protein
MVFDTIDELDEMYFSLVLPSYTLKQIPTQSARSLNFHLHEMFERGEIYSVDEMRKEIDRCIEIGLVNGLFFEVEE